MPPKKGGGKADSKKNNKYRPPTHAMPPYDDPHRELGRYVKKYCALHDDHKPRVPYVDSFKNKLLEEREEWTPEMNPSEPYKCKGRLLLMRPPGGEKAKGGGDFPPNFPIIFNGCLDPPVKLSYAQTRLFIDSLGWWPRTWRGSEAFGGMNFLGFWKCWGEGEDVCSGDDGAMLMMEFLKHDSLEPQDLGKWETDYSEPLCPSSGGGSYAVNLKNLEMVWCGITSEGCRLLGRALTQNETLKYLNLSHNPDIGDDGIEALGEGLKWNSSLETLKLEYCGIGWKGGEHVGKYIVRASSVKNLHLKGNNIGAKGLQGVSGALARNMTLERLDLSDNCFGIHADAIEALRDGIEANDSLTAIDLNLNSMVPPGAMMLLEVLKTKPKIKEFSIFERIEDDLFQSIMTEVQLHAKGSKKGKKGKKKK
eukprot:TRINITY_DN1954_c1_g1_i5.p1 TRINITY_DN1954_c1_g1~~TRINITY_DN1954_c1_g1_i5.p1  ORF type:complete len:431 (+),score=57.99 TRINITY_DN1954_c1_g1_i5:30-1295(+)